MSVSWDDRQRVNLAIASTPTRPEARPFLLWPDRDDSPEPRHAARRMFRSLTKALRKG
jgi:hypothetical protein